MFLPLGLLVMGRVWGCKSRDLELVGEAGCPFVLLLSPAHQADRDDLDALESFVHEHSGLHLEARVAESQAKAIAGAGAHGADAWLLPLFDYLFCHQEYGAQARLQVLRRGRTDYHGVIVVQADEPIEGLADLEGAPLAFVERYSTSGFVYPARLLRDAGVQPKPVFAGAHDRALALLRDGKVAAAATYRAAVVEDPSLRIVAKTHPIPNEPVFFRKGLEPHKRDRFVEALMAFSETPGGKQVLDRIAGIEGFRRIDDFAFRSVHEDIRGAERAIQDLVPKGWWIHHQNRAPLSAHAP